MSIQVTKTIDEFVYCKPMILQHNSVILTTVTNFGNLSVYKLRADKGNYCICPISFQTVINICVPSQFFSFERFFAIIKISYPRANATRDKVHAIEAADCIMHVKIKRLSVRSYWFFPFFSFSLFVKRTFFTQVSTRKYFLHFCKYF